MATTPSPAKVEEEDEPNRHPCLAMCQPHKWIRGELSYPAPPLMEGLYALEHLSRHELTGEPLDCDRVNFFRKILVEPEGDRPDISEHFDMVTTHRGYVKAAYELEEHMLWTTALAHHYRKNDHHREYFSRYGLLEPEALCSMSGEP